MECGTDRPWRVLVVDDDVSLGQLTAQVLTRSNFQVDTAEDGASGWAALHARQYDLLITDNVMPKISGVELIRKLRATGLKVLVIMATGTLPAQKLASVAMLLKPFTPEELLGTVRRALGEMPVLRSGSSSGLA